MEQKQENELDIEKVMTEIRKAAEAYSFDTIPEFQELETDLRIEKDYDSGLLQDIVRKMCMGYAVTTETPFPTGIVKGIVKKAVRKTNRFWAMPITVQQTEFNALTTRGLNQIAFYISEQEKSIKLLEERIFRLEQELGAMKKE